MSRRDRSHNSSTDKGRTIMSVSRITQMPEPSDEFTFQSVWIPLDVIRLNPAKYQRTYDPGWAKKMADSWDARLYNPIKVAKVRRQSEVWYEVWDGQHRRGALALLGAAGAWCLVCEAPTEVQAELFRKEQQARKSLTTADDYHAGIVQGDPVVVSVERVLKANGFYLPRKKKTTCENGRFPINTVKPLLEIGKRSPENLSDVLTVIRDAWGTDPDAYLQPMLYGMDMFLRKYPDVDRAAVSKRLAMMMTPRKLQVDAQATRTTLGYNSGTAVGQMILAVYNKGRRSGHLPNRFNA